MHNEKQHMINRKFLHHYLLQIPTFFPVIAEWYGPRIGASTSKLFTNSFTDLIFDLTDSRIILAQL